MKTIVLLVFIPFVVADWKQVLIQKHNAARSEVNLGTVTWDADLASFASDTARKLREGNNCIMEHTSNAERKMIKGWVGEQAGENLAWGYDSRGFKGPLANDKIAAAGADGWIKEKLDWESTSNSCSNGKQCGHYTQIVWKESEKIGCAIDLCNGNTSYILACNYMDGGNIIGVHPFNRTEGAPAAGNFKCTESDTTESDGTRIKITCDESCKKTTTTRKDGSSSIKTMCLGKK